MKFDINKERETNPSIEEPLVSSFFDNRLEWLTSREAALFLRVSVGQIRNMVWRRQIKFYKLGRKLRFQKRDVEKLLRPSGMENNL